MAHALLAAQVIGSISEGAAEKEASEVNAENISRQGQQEQAIASMRAEQRKERGKELLAQNRARLAAEGADTTRGSPLDFLAENESDIELQSLIDAQNGINANQSSIYRAALERQRGKKAFQQGILNAGTQLAGGIGGSIGGGAVGGISTVYTPVNDPRRELRRAGFG